MNGSVSRSGITLIELVVVVVVLGVVAGIAVPNYRDAQYRADAASVVADMSAVRHAVVEYHADHNSYPEAGAWGVMPSELQPYLGDMPFRYKGLEYRLQTEPTVDFTVRYPEGDPIGAALREYRPPGAEEGAVAWTPPEVEFRLACGESGLASC